MSHRLFHHLTETPWVKFCGLRDPEQARRLADLGPSAIGVNFYPHSPRFINGVTARVIQEQLPADILSVGVFVNASTDQIVATVREAHLGAIQLHGDEPPEQLAELRGRLPEAAILRAWRVGPEGLRELAGYLSACSVRPDAVLIDASRTGEFGGTGQTAPWHLLQDYRRDWPPMILAGGLHPGNVAEAIAAVAPCGVDTASGIESTPGVKDLQLAEAFLAAVREEASNQMKDGSIRQR